MSVSSSGKFSFGSSTSGAGGKPGVASDGSKKTLKGKENASATAKHFSLLSLKDDVAGSADCENETLPVKQAPKKERDGWSRFEIRCFVDSLERYGAANMRKVQVCVATKTLHECVSFLKKVQSGSSGMDARLEKRRKRMNKHLANNVSAASSTRALRRLSIMPSSKTFVNFRKKTKKSRQTFASVFEEEGSAVGPLASTFDEKATETRADIADFPSSILPAVFDFLAPADLLSRCCAVSKSWNAAARAAANLAAAIRPVDAVIDVPWSRLLDAFPSGSFLSEGSYKQVYKVRSAALGRWEAISVMDIGNADAQIVENEVSVGLATTALVENGVCPNFVRTFQVLQLPCAPPDDEWAPSRAKEEKHAKVFQYARMELCSHGDVESYMKTLPEEMLPLDAAVDFAFQMIFAMHAAREQFSLRHHDIKLLNFFVSDRNDGHVFEYTFGKEQLSYLSQDSRVVKLADYGTADTNRDFDGKCIEARHFGTLENSPPEYLLEEFPAQSWATDTFALGLAVLHLFTGSKPYEEIMDEVLCPDVVADTLLKEWQSKPKRRYAALASVLEDDDEAILANTLYRYIVLLGIPAEEPGESRATTMLRAAFETSSPRKARAAHLRSTCII